MVGSGNDAIATKITNLLCQSNIFVFTVQCVNSSLIEWDGWNFQWWLLNTIIARMKSQPFLVPNTCTCVYLSLLRWLLWWCEYWYTHCQFEYHIYNCPPIPRRMHRGKSFEFVGSTIVSVLHAIVTAVSERVDDIYDRRMWYPSGIRVIRRRGP